MQTIRSPVAQCKRRRSLLKCRWESSLNIWEKKINSILPHTVHQNKFQMDLKVKYKKRNKITEQSQKGQGFF